MIQENAASTVAIPKSQSKVEKRKLELEPSTSSEVSKNTRQLML
jgi:hypothetical protein